MCQSHPKQLYFWPVPGLKEILGVNQLGLSVRTCLASAEGQLLTSSRAWVKHVASKNCACALTIWSTPHSTVRQRYSVTVCLFPSPFSHNVMLEHASFCSIFFFLTPLFHSTSFPSSLHPPARKGDQPAGRLCWDTRWPAYLGLHSLPVSSQQPLLSFAQLCFG